MSVLFRTFSGGGDGGCAGAGESSGEARDGLAHVVDRHHHVVAGHGRGGSGLGVRGVARGW